MGFILVNLTVRIISVGYGYDLTRTSVVWCKVRQYLLLILGLISFMLSCLAVIDQFLATSRNANLRRVSNISWSHRIVCVVLIVCCLYGIPALVFVDISPNLKICVIANANYAIYISVHVLSFTCIIPVLVTVIFGYLTYRSIHSTRVLVEQQVDRQLVRMVLSEVAIIVVSITPYGVNTNRSPRQLPVCYAIFITQEVAICFCFHQVGFAKQSKIESCSGKKREQYTHPELWLL
ncbi:unnamed protein product [Adineta ricciae]|uniref:G-protein coupled receptors family 1 profile domain-containing protein n=1 Tax=Adineta ricciae TaxID=249248 RepID=A0A814TLE8_ADIRI|nr:unnamed protein product [Adineta ricciae]